MSHKVVPDSNLDGRHKDFLRLPESIVSHSRYCYDTEPGRSSSMATATWSSAGRLAVYFRDNLTRQQHTQDQHAISKYGLLG